MKKTIKNTAVIIFVTTAVCFCLKYPGEMGQSVRAGIDRCLEIIVPSMFIFMCLTTFISMSGLHELAGRPLKFLSEKVFRLPSCGFSLFLLSLISGYPAGIKLVTDSYSRGELSKGQKSVLSCICCSGGPAFISGTAAACLYPNSNAAPLIFLSIVLSNLITAFIMTRKLPRIMPQKSAYKELQLSTLIPAVRSASSAMLQMCIMITAFSGILCIIEKTGVLGAIALPVSRIANIEPDSVKSAVMSFLEISSIVDMKPMQPQLLPLVTFLLSFGGVCVLLQITALADKDFSIKKFLTVRLLTALEAAAISKLLLPLLSVDTQSTAVFAPYHTSLTAQPSGNFPFVAILLLGMMWGVCRTFNDKS